MAKVILNGKEKEVKDNSLIKEACKELGVEFACEEGYCGSCRIEILEGADQLNELSPNEVDSAMSRTERFACQCRLKKGILKIKY